jgi:hypothetical protein
MDDIGVNGRLAWMYMGSEVDSKSLERSTSQYYSKIIFKVLFV